MINLTLLVVGIMIVPAVVGGFIFAAKDRGGNPYPQIEVTKTAKTVLSWPEDYIRNYYDGIYALKKDTLSAEIFCKLEKVNKTTLKGRKRDKYDDWFDNNIKNFCKSGEALAYIARYGNLTDRFIAKLKNPQYDANFQKYLVSVHRNNLTGTYFTNCQNLLWYYLEKWDLLPEIKKVIKEDARFGRVMDIYLKQRGEIHVV